MSRNIFQIEQGRLGLAVVDKAAVGYSDSWQGPDGATLDDVTLADYDTNSSGWSCQITSGSINATADTTTTDVPATWCEPAETIPSPGKSTFELAVTFLQDPNLVNGLNRFLFQHDTEEAFAYVGLNAEDPPKAIGRVRLSAATIGGEARTTLTADVTLPFSRKPDIEFGDATESEIVEGGEAALATDKGSASPGDVFAAEGTVTASSTTTAGLLAGLGFVADPTSAWVGNQSIEVGEWPFYWNGTAWKPGDARRAAAGPTGTTVFPADPEIVASDATNAGRLAGEGFVASPTAAWTTGQSITVGSYQFNWTGSAWAAGAHA